MLKIGIITFENIEELDFIGPFETISYINKLYKNSVKVDLLSTSLDIVTAFNGLRFLPNELFNNETQYDIVIIPGGKGRKQAAFNHEILDFIKKQAPNAKLICSVCTGSFILAETGLVNNLKATTHYTALDEMKNTYPSMQILNERIVKNEKYWFAAGISSGIDLSLEIIKTLFGKKEKEEIARRLEYRNIQL